MNTEKDVKKINFIKDNTIQEQAKIIEQAASKLTQLLCTSIEDIFTKQGGKDVNKTTNRLP